MNESRRSADLVDLLKERARQNEKGEAFHFVTESTDGESRRSVSFADIDHEATALADELVGVTESDAAGLPVVVALSDNHDFVLALFATWMLGGVPVPAPAMGRTRIGRERVEHIVSDCSAAFALVDGSTADRLTDLVGATVHGPTRLLPGVVVVSFGQRCAISSPGTPFAPDRGADKFALVQYTSGSTSAPKGVVLTHANLLANLATIESAVRLGTSTRMCSWLPLYHDMGLIGTVLYPMFAGGSAIHIRPSHFVKRPYRWLQLVAEARATIVVAPNFGYQMCLDTRADARLDGCDLSSLQVALNGSEPIEETTLTKFRERFAPFGLKPEALTPCYGMAEASLLISCGDVDSLPAPADLSSGELAPTAAGRGGTAGRVVSCGRARDFDLAVVESDSGRRIPDGRVGEIWVRGPSVAAGYWDRRAGAVVPFAARTDDGEGGYLRTGDLGAQRDGDIYVVGRSKDVLILRGRNVYPHDLEREVRLAHPLLGQSIAAVFPAPGMAHSVIAVVEVPTQHGQEGARAEAVQAVRVGLARQFDVSAAGVVLVRNGQIPRTTSGKVQRQRAHEIFVDGGFDAVAETVDERVTRTRAVGPPTSADHVRALTSTEPGTNRELS